MYPNTSLSDLPTLIRVGIYINNYFKQICYVATLTWKKIVYIYILIKKYILYTKLTYFDHPNKNVKHLDLKITRIWVQQK